MAASDFAPDQPEKLDGRSKALVLIFPCKTARAKQPFITRRLSRVKPAKGDRKLISPDWEKNRFSSRAAPRNGATIPARKTAQH